MSKSNSSILILIISMLFISNNVVAASYEIEMLNKLGKEKMLFSKKVIKIDINDEVLWKSVDKGHNVEFIGMPDGALKYKSKPLRLTRINDYAWLENQYNDYANNSK